MTTSSHTGDNPIPTTIVPEETRVYGWWIKLIAGIKKEDEDLAVLAIDSSPFDQ